jgi:hypothetical protein
MRRPALLSAPVLGLGLLAGCGGGSAASSGHATTYTCWGYSNTSPVVWRTADKYNVGCGGVYGPGGPYSGSPGQPAGATGTPVCTVTFPAITWTVWDPASTGFGESFCTQLQGDPK